MKNPLFFILVLIFTTVLTPVGSRAATPSPGSAPASQPAAPTSRISPLTADQLIQILDQTVDWYRTLGTQQQHASQPSDLLILYANRQTADKVVSLAFDIARANAELLSSDVDTAQAAAAAAGRQPQQLADLQHKAVARVADLQAQIQRTGAQLPTAKGAARTNLAAKGTELQGELAMVKAQKNMLDNMSQFVSENDSQRASVSALKSRIDAIAASIPAAAAAATSASVTTSTIPAAATASTTDAAAGDTAATTSGGLGIWELVQNALHLSRKLDAIDAIDVRTAALRDTFIAAGKAPDARLKALSTRSDQLANAANQANGPALTGLRDQFDTLAWLFNQTSSIAMPLGKESVLLAQYRANLTNWRQAVQHQFTEVRNTLWTRLGILVALLAAVFVGGELWRRAVLHYFREPRRRSQLLLVRNLVQWALVILILALAFATRLSSFATFAGLLTAGVAVAMQSILVSVVGYFLLIGKYGIRVGDRVQIGSVLGEVVELGLVRIHLMELSTDGPLGPTGRIVAFANSIVFQSSGGLFRQVPGVNLTWHELTLPLPAGSDPAAVKERLLATLNGIVGEHQGEVDRQSQVLRKVTDLPAGDFSPQVQLYFSSSGVEAKVRYPVPLNRAAAVDERVAEELLKVVRKPAGAS